MSHITESPEYARQLAEHRAAAEPVLTMADLKQLAERRRASHERRTPPELALLVIADDLERIAAGNMSPSDMAEMSYAVHKLRRMAGPDNRRRTFTSRRTS